MNLSRSKPRTWSICVAVVAAYMLVLQGLLGAFAIGAAGAPAMVDEFGTPICVTSPATTDSGSDGPTHVGLTDCCAAGCVTAYVARGADRFGEPLASPSLAAAGPFWRYVVVAGRFSRDEHPGSPRAPPSAS